MWKIKLERLSLQLKPFKPLEHCRCFQALIAGCKTSPFFYLLARVYAGEIFCEDKLAGKNLFTF